MAGDVRPTLDEDVMRPLADNRTKPSFTSTAGGSRHVLPARPELRGAVPLFTLCLEVRDHRRAVEPSSRAKGFGAGKGFRWTTRPGSSGLDPAHRREPRGRPPWGRRSPYRHPRQMRGRAVAGGQDYPRPPMRRSISAPTTAGCWSRAPTRDGFRVIDAFSRIIRLGEGMPAPAGSARRRSSARSRRLRSAATRCATAASRAPG